MPIVNGTPQVDGWIIYYFTFEFNYMKMLGITIGNTFDTQNNIELRHDQSSTGTFLKKLTIKNMSAAETLFSNFRILFRVSYLFIYCNNCIFYFSSFIDWFSNMLILMLMMLWIPNVYASAGRSNYLTKYLGTLNKDNFHNLRLTSRTSLVHCAVR